MNLHTLTGTPGSRKGRTRVGRGMSSGSGKTSGRGHKGQKARKGYSRRAGFEGGQMRLIRRVPKRGFTNPTRREYLPVNVGSLERFENETEVTPELLLGAGLAKGRASGVKILGRGKLTKKLKVKASAFSETARQAIEAVGGSCEALAD